MQDKSNFLSVVSSTVSIKKIIIILILFFFPSSFLQADSEIIKANSGRIGIISGAPSGNYIKIATDLARLLNNYSENVNDRIRIIPMVGSGSVQNIKDVLYLQGVDLAIVQSDILEYVRGVNKEIDVFRRIGYVTKLYNEEIHIISSNPNIKEIKDLNKIHKIAVGGAGSGSSITAQILFNMLNIETNLVNTSNDAAFRDMLEGEIDALIVVAKAPISFLSAYSISTEFHFVDIEYTDILKTVYYKNTLNSEQYPEIIDNADSVETVSVPSVLIGYDWQINSPRGERIARFCEALFKNKNGLHSNGYSNIWDDFLEKDYFFDRLSGWKRMRGCEYNSFNGGDFEIDKRWFQGINGD